MTCSGTRGGVGGGGGGDASTLPKNKHTAPHGTGQVHTMNKILMHKLYAFLSNVNTKT